ncbi:hypothetical protein [Salinisphaera aquimarina]|uniref:DUF4136 domain-containing protein n=1 Tax=Salinisphaera aquimarina TaxID=2094031 RepID=A0ABV7ESV7_9GAMM
MIVALAAALLPGCATAPASYDFVDPAYDEIRYDGFMAYAAFADRAIEAAFEQALCKRLNSAGHACTTMLREAPPTREQDAASRHRASRASGAQATIVIEIADPQSVSRQIIAGGRPAYEVSLVDNADQLVTGRFYIEAGTHRDDSVARQARALADRITAALDEHSLLQQRTADSP